MLPLKILKFYGRRDVYFCILKLQTFTSFQVVVYEAQFFSQSVMTRFLFLTNNERGDFMPRVIKWKLHGKVCFTLDKTHQEKGTIVT